MQERLCESRAQERLCESRAQERLCESRAQERLCESRAQERLCESRAQEGLCESYAQERPSESSAWCLLCNATLRCHAVMPGCDEEESVADGLSNCDCALIELVKWHRSQDGVAERRR